MAANNIAVVGGEAGFPAFPHFPQFEEVDVPQNVFLIERTVAGVPVKTRVTPVRAWQGLITPLPDDDGACNVVRALVADADVKVDGGHVVALDNPELRPIRAETRMRETGLSFDVLVLEFDPPSHPWVFSLSPAIRQRPERHHPHLRSDRIVELPSRTVHGFCVYSSAEFKFDESSPAMEQFLAQVSIFLAKHVVWLKTLGVVNAKGEVIHDGLSLETLYSSVPASNLWQRNPEERAIWLGFWPGTSAENGEAHLRLDPEKECWCGKGKLYKNCCLLWEQNFYQK